MNRWPAQGPPVLWRVPGGVGMSAIAVSDSRAVTMWNSERGQVIVALNVDDGSRIWETPIAPNYENGQGDGPRGTPLIADGRVFAYTGDGILACVRLDSGEEIWKENIVASSGGRPAEYGMACSPLMVGDLIIVTAGGPAAAVVAVDAATGQTRWSSGSGTPGYSSPALLNVGDEQHVVTFTGMGVSGIRPEDGTVLWTYPFKTPYDCNTATPIGADGDVFISAGENHGCARLSIKKTNDQYAVRESWMSVDVKSVMRNEWQTSVLIDGYLYGFDNVGSAGPTTHLTCVNAKTGEVAWQKTRFGKGNLVAADGHLWITTMKGEMVVAKASPRGYVELGRKRLFGKTRQTLSISNQRAYIRDDDQVVCIDISR